MAGMPRTHVRMNERMEMEFVRQCDGPDGDILAPIAGFTVENDNSLPYGVLAFYTPGGPGDVVCFI